MYARILLAAVCFSGVLVGCQRTGGTVPIPSGASGVSGWQIRYNATLALAHRGSALIKEPDIWDLLVEMLDEQQQLRNFRTTLGGREVSDETAARLTIIGALKAVQELHHRQPQMDLSGLKEPIEKLTQSPAAPVSTEAQQTLLALRAPA